MFALLSMLYIYIYIIYNYFQYSQQPPGCVRRYVSFTRRMYFASRFGGAQHSFGFVFVFSKKKNKKIKKIYFILEPMTAKGNAAARWTAQITDFGLSKQMKVMFL